MKENTHPAAVSPARQRFYSVLYGLLRGLSAGSNPVFRTLMRLSLYLFTLPGGGRFRASAPDPSPAASVPAGQPVTDQGALQAVRFGRSTAAAAGCEAIAVYNAGLLTGAGRASLDEVLRRTEDGGALMRRGRFGTDPYRLGPLLRTLGMESRRLFSMKELQAQTKPGDIAVVSVWTMGAGRPPTVHTFAVRRGGGGFTTWNQRYGPQPLPPEESAACFRKDLFLVAYPVRRSDREPGSNGGNI